VPHISPDEDPHSDITTFLLSIGMLWRRNRMKLVLNNT